VSPKLQNQNLNLNQNNFKTQEDEKKRKATLKRHQTFQYTFPLNNSSYNNQQQNLNSTAHNSISYGSFPTVNSNKDSIYMPATDNLFKTGLNNNKINTSPLLNFFNSNNQTVGNGAFYLGTNNTSQGLFYESNKPILNLSPPVDLKVKLAVNGISKFAKAGSLVPTNRNMQTGLYSFIFQF
jgi:hypothetical protein